ncbi:MAG TPA: hypothetical protein VK208_22055 [Pyrinomonadaceae bacterium]|nr:hypothetical protein [Pyrinomonadaceae bacterium]
MEKLGWRQWLVVIAFVLVLSFTGLFVLRTVRRAIYWHYHQDEVIRPWMSLGYVAHSYSVPPWVLHRAVGLPIKPGRPDRRPIRQIAREQNRSVDEVIADLQQAIVHSRPPYPRPPDAPPDDAAAQPQLPAFTTEQPRGPTPTPQATTEPTRGRSP